MTILSAVQSAATRLVGSKPNAVFSAADATALQFQDLATESATAIAKAHDWRELTTLATIAGDGSTESFSLPTDFDRMKRETGVYVDGTLRQIQAAQDMDQWLQFVVNDIVGTPGFWIIFGGQIHIKPALAATETAKYYYQTTKIFETGGTPTASLTADTQTFRLPERLLTLDIIWRWRARKGLDYAQDKANFDIAFGEEAGRDRGARVLAMGRRRYASGVELAYPKQITP
jgi:hypothetical protein